MDLKAMLRAAQRFTINNSPVIMTGIGAAGVVATAIMTGKAGYSAAMEIRDVEDGRSEILSSKERAELVWKRFIPPAAVAMITLAAIIGANRVEARRAAALAAAFKISEKMADEYRQKVIETMGSKDEELMSSELAKERINRLDSLESLETFGSQELFYDSWSGRAFPCTREKVHAAVNQINHQINHEFSASMSDFFDLIDQPRTGVSDEFGWNSDQLLEPWYTATLLPSGRAAIEIRYNVVPFRHFDKVGN